MAQTGFTPIQLYRTATASAAPTSGNLADGELAINTNDGKLFYKDSGGNIQTIATKAGANGDVVGPASATADDLVAFNGTTGKLVKVAGTVTIAQGGTGATTASGALTNLGAVAKAGDTMTGVLAVTAGTVSAPGLTFSGDTNTGIYSPAADTIAFAEGGTEAMRITSTGNIAIGSPTGGVVARLDVIGPSNLSSIRTLTTDSVGDQNFEANFIDYNVSGADPLTTSKNHNGLRVDVDSTASGGTTVNEHVLRGVYATVDVGAAGVSQSILGSQSVVRTLNTTGTVNDMYGAFNGANVDPGVGGTVSTAYGSINQAYAGGAGTISTIYGSRNEAVVEGAATAGVTNAYGTFNEIEIDGNTLGNAYATYSVVNSDGGVTTNGYLYRGEYQISAPGTVTNAWGLYLTGSTKNYVAGQIQADAGTAAAPTFSQFTDTNTGIFFPAADTIAFAEGGAESMRIDSAGNVGIGTTAPGALLNVVANTATDAFRITQTGTGNALVVEDSANPDSTPFVVNTNGQVIQGYTADITSASFQANGANTFSGVRWNSGTQTGTAIILGRSRSATIGTNAIVLTGDNLGAINFSGDDGAAFIRAASISADVDLTPGTNDMPGRLVFSTTADGAATPTERMRITSTGNVGIGTTAPTAMLDINSNTLRLRTAKTPASAADTGNAGDIAWDANYIYVCTATNTWKRTALATW